MSKKRNRLPVVSNLDMAAKLWAVQDAAALAQRAAEREAWELQVAEKERAIKRVALLKKEARLAWRISAERLKWCIERLTPPVREPTVWVGSSLGGPAPGPHYPSHMPGPGVPAYLHDGGRGSGGGSRDAGDYTLQDVG